MHYQVVPIFPTTFHIEAIKGKSITFRFRKESNLSIEKVELRIVQATTSTSVYPVTYQDSSGCTTMEYRFTRKQVKRIKT